VRYRSDLPSLKNHSNREERLKKEYPELTIKIQSKKGENTFMKRLDMEESFHASAAKDYYLEMESWILCHMNFVWTYYLKHLELLAMIPRCIFAIPAKDIYQRKRCLLCVTKIAFNFSIFRTMKSLI